MNDHKHLTHCECGVHIHTTDPTTHHMYIVYDTGGENIYKIFFSLFYLRSDQIAQPGK